jgi:hypothetical protein
MTQLVKIEPDRRDEILMDAADRQLPVVLSRRLDQNWSTYKAAVLEADSSGEFIVLGQPVVAPGQAPPEFVPGERLGLSFRRGHKKCLSSVEVLGIVTHEIAPGEKIQAIQVSWPDKLEELQRRLYFRASVPTGRRIEARMWEASVMDRCSGKLEDVPHHSGRLEDISVGGCRVIVDAAHDPKLTEGDTVIIQFQPDPRTPCVRLEAMYRHVDEDYQGKRALGFQFVGLEMCSEGREMLQALSRVVSTFLRIEQRRSKKSLPRNNPRRK